MYLRQPRRVASVCLSSCAGLKRCPCVFHLFVAALSSERQVEDGRQQEDADPWEQLLEAHCVRRDAGRARLRFLSAALFSRQLLLYFPGRFGVPAGTWVCGRRLHSSKRSSSRLSRRTPPVNIELGATHDRTPHSSCHQRMGNPQTHTLIIRLLLPEGALPRAEMCWDGD